MWEMRSAKSTLLPYDSSYTPLALTPDLGEGNETRSQPHYEKKKKRESVSCSVVSDSTNPWSVPHQAPLSTGCSRQGYWSG